MPPAMAGAVAALWSVTFTLLLLLIAFVVAWIFNHDASARVQDALATAASLWLLTHSASISFEGLTISQAPLGLTFLSLMVMRHFTIRSLRSSLVYTPGQALLIPVSFAGTFAFLSALITLPIASVVNINTSIVLLTSSAWGLLGSAVALFARVELVPIELPEHLAAGSAQANAARPRAVRDLMIELLSEIPPLVRLSFRTGLQVVVLWSIAALLVTLALAVARFGEFANILSVLATSGFELGQLGFLSLAYLPNLALWLLAVMLGPGVVIGGGVLNLVNQSLGPLPTLPWLAFLPSTLPESAKVLWVLPLVIALIAVRGLIRETKQARTIDVVAAGLVAATTAGLATAVVLVVSRGDLGAGRYLSNGPEVALSAGSATLCVALAITLSALWASNRARATA